MFVGLRDDDGHWAWSAFILPYMEQSALFAQIGVTGITPTQAISLNPAIMNQKHGLFRCPSDAGPDTHNADFATQATAMNAVGYAIAGMGRANIGLSVSNYVVSNNTHQVRNRGAGGNNGLSGATGLFFRDSGQNFSAITDGTSNSLMIGERGYVISGKVMRAGTVFATRDRDRGGPPAADEPNSYWNQGLMTIAGTTFYGINGVLPASTGSGQCAQCQGYSSNHRGGGQFVYGDGHVQFISQNIGNNQSAIIDSTFEAIAGIADGVVAGTAIA